MAQAALGFQGNGQQAGLQGEARPGRQRGWERGWCLRWAQGKREPSGMQSHDTLLCRGTPIRQKLYVPLLAAFSLLFFSGGNGGGGEKGQV